ncbi:hypothetical protein [Streptomyces sp. NBC_00233]|uniref:hypothetical protein n=1 Tax=Streptomyces sp. NBC_00233 TaxID=2975686 RepID=UPI00225430A7|nr:hypothetical protein [Streptomyces sp. NBC_00233]
MYLRGEVLGRFLCRGLAAVGLVVWEQDQPGGFFKGCEEGQMDASVRAGANWPGEEEQAPAGEHRPGI